MERRRRQRKPREGEVWVRLSDRAAVKVVAVRARSVSYENVVTGRRGSSALPGFLQRFQLAEARATKVVGRIPVPSNVVPIGAARRPGAAPRPASTPLRRGAIRTLARVR